MANCYADVLAEMTRAIHKYVVTTEGTLPSIIRLLILRVTMASGFNITSVVCVGGVLVLPSKML